MTPGSDELSCRECGRPVVETGPAIALAGANGFSGPAFVPFVNLAVTLGTAGLVHIDCFAASNGHPALAELLHAPKARAMGAP
jgi:hypothetical protein